MSLFHKISNFRIDTKGDFTYVITQKHVNQRTTKEAFVTGISTELQTAGFIKSTGVFAQVKVKTIASNYTASSGDNLILVDASAGNIVIDLPDVITFWDDALELSNVLEIKRIDESLVNTVTIIPVISQTIDNDPSLVLATATTPAVRIYTDGTNWWSSGN